MRIDLNDLSLYAGNRDYFAANGEVFDILPIFDVQNQKGELLGRIRRDHSGSGLFHFTAILPSGMGRWFRDLPSAIGYLKQCREEKNLYPKDAYDIYRVLELKAQEKDDGGIPAGQTWYANFLRSGYFPERIRDWSFFLRDIANKLHRADDLRAGDFYNISYAIGPNIPEEGKDPLISNPFALDEEYLADPKSGGREELTVSLGVVIPSEFIDDDLKRYLGQLLSYLVQKQPVSV